MFGELKEGKTLYDLYPNVDEILKELQYPEITHPWSIQYEFYSPLTKGELLCMLSNSNLDIIGNGAGNYKWSLEEKFAICDKAMLGEEYVNNPYDLYSFILKSKMGFNNIWELRKIWKELRKSTAYNNPISILTTEHTYTVSIQAKNSGLHFKNKVYTIFEQVGKHLNTGKVNLSYSKGAFIYSGFKATKSTWDMKCNIYLLQELHNCAASSDYNEHTPQNLYQITKYPILWHFVSTKKQITCQK